MNATSNVHVVRDTEGPHDDLFHFMRDDVVLPALGTGRPSHGSTTQSGHKKGPHSRAFL